MIRRGGAAAVLALLALGCGGDDEPVVPRSDAFAKLQEGLGGKADLEALETLRIVAGGVRNIPNEGTRPTDPAIEANRFTRTVSIDLRADSLRVDTERTVAFLFPGMSAYSDVVRGNLGASTQPFFGAPLGALGSDKVAAIRRQETLLTPHLLVKGLTSASFTTQPDVTLDGVSHHRLVLEDEPAPLTLFVDAQTGTLSKLETTELDYFLRDSTLEVFFDGWAAAGDIVFPRQLRLARGGQTLLSQDVTSVEVNGTFEADVFEFPNGATPTFNQELFERGELTHQWYYLLDSIGLPFNGVDTAIMPFELGAGAGVVQLRGGSHHSFLVEQASGIVLVDAPFYEDRGQALSQHVAQTYPGKPITHVVASHFHEDHAAGIREVLGSNPSAQLVVHESVLDTWRTILAAPSTLRPDALARSPREVTILTVPDDAELTLADAQHPLTLYPLESSHAVDLLLVHEASTNSVFVVDIYSPGLAYPAAADFAASLVEHAIPTGDLQVVGGHGAEVHDFAQVQAQLPQAQQP
jgi:glyoxylase-like metal-dependent hydrolase (beta-lactamase superfamily II)